MWELATETGYVTESYEIRGPRIIAELRKDLADFNVVGTLSSFKNNVVTLETFMA